MARVDSFLRLVVDQRASDLHLRPGYKPTVRYCGDLHPMPFRILSQEEAAKLVTEIMSSEQREVLEKEQEVDFAYELPGSARFRVHAFKCSGGVAAVLRA